MTDANPLNQLDLRKKYNPTQSVFSKSIYTLITLEVVRYTTRSAHIIAQQLLLLKRFQVLFIVVLSRK